MQISHVLLIYYNIQMSHVLFNISDNMQMSHVLFNISENMQISHVLLIYHNMQISHVLGGGDSRRVVGNLTSYYDTTNN